MLINKKVLTCIVTVQLCFFLTVSCGKNTVNTDTNNKEQVQPEKTLCFRINWEKESERGQAINQIIETYNSKNSSGCIIETVSGDEDLTATETMLKEGSDTVYLLPYRYVQYFGSKGYLKDMTSDFMSAEALYYPEIWKLGTVEGTVYGLPWIGHSMCLLYNKSLLNSAGVDANEINSLDAFTSALEKVEANTGARGFGLVGADGNDVSWMVNQFIYGFGGKLVNDEGTSVLINSDKSRAALDYYKNTLGAHAQTNWTEDTGHTVMSYFRKQEVAFEIQGIWGISDIDKNGSPFEVGIIPLKNIGVCSEVGPKMLAIPAGMSEKMKSEAVNFIEYMISMEGQEAVLKGEYSPEHEAYYPFRTPIRIDMADSPLIKKNPEYMTFIESFDNPSIDAPVPEWQKIKEELYEPGLHKVMTGELSINDFLIMIEKEGNVLLKQH
jgi:ABC-type glycerol-3-phosphate transport system substrate-binding protein